MKITEPVEVSKLVRADSEEARDGFREYDEIGEGWDYFVPMDDNSSHLYIRRNIQDGRSIFIEPDRILVFNIKYNIAGIIKADTTVEPVELTVKVERKNV